MNANIPLLGIGVRAKAGAGGQCPAACRSHCRDTAARAWSGGGCGCNTDYVGDGYGIPTAGALEAIAMFAELEGILLDPVYSAKGAAGMIDLIRKGVYTKDQRIMFIHTGGAAASSGMIRLRN